MVDDRLGDIGIVDGVLDGTVGAGGAWTTVVSSDPSGTSFTTTSTTGGGPGGTISTTIASSSSSPTSLGRDGGPPSDGEGGGSSGSALRTLIGTSGTSLTPFTGVGRDGPSSPARGDGPSSGFDFPATSRTTWPPAVMICMWPCMTYIPPFIVCIRILPTSSTSSTPRPRHTVRIIKGILRDGGSRGGGGNLDIDGTVPRTTRQDIPIGVVHFEGIGIGAVHMPLEGGRGDRAVPRGPRPVQNTTLGTVQDIVMVHRGVV